MERIEAQYLFDNNSDCKTSYNVGNDDEHKYEAEAMSKNRFVELAIKLVEKERQLAVAKSLVVASEKAKVCLLVGECKKECEVSSQLTAMVDRNSILSLESYILKSLEKQTKK